MCLICVDLLKGNITAKEAMRNYYEMVEGMDPTHAEEVADQIQVAIFTEELGEK